MTPPTRPISPAWVQAIRDWLSYCQAKGTPGTTLATRRSHLLHLGRHVGVADPWLVTGAILLAWCGTQTWAPETRRGRRSTFRAFYGWAVDQGHVVASPALALPTVKPTAPNPRPAPDSVYLPTLASADPRERLMLRLAAEHGMRRAEIAQVHTGRDLLEDLAGWSLLVHGKGGKERVVPLLDDVAGLLRALPRGYAFPGADAGHLSPRWVGMLVNRLLPEGWTIHKLRHRAATRWWEASEGDLFLVQRLLGHQSPVTTQAYVKVHDARLRRTVQRAA